MTTKFSEPLGLGGGTPAGDPRRTRRAVLAGVGEARNDPENGDARLIGATGYQQIFGLGYWGDRVYGFTNDGDYITIDGSTGEVMLGEIPTVTPKLTGGFEELMKWADRIRRLKVRTNADTPQDAELARRFGAEGIGLCRTEHMFFEQERLPTVQRMILADTSAERKAALDELLPFQRSDFEGLFEAMDGYPVIIRLIDPPLHEFLPSEEELLEEVVTMRVKGETDGLAEKEDLLDHVQGLHESNPMMGLRGIRLSIVMPEIVEMQVRAIFEAAGLDADLFMIRQDLNTFYH